MGNKINMVVGAGVVGTLPDMRRCLAFAVLQHFLNHFPATTVSGIGTRDSPYLKPFKAYSIRGKEKRKVKKKKKRQGQYLARL